MDVRAHIRHIHRSDGIVHTDLTMVRRPLTSRDNTPKASRAHKVEPFEPEQEVERTCYVFERPTILTKTVSYR
jgi:hypothetical protein